MQYPHALGTFILSEFFDSIPPCFNAVNCI
jgi:hypothetical protein